MTKRRNFTRLIAGFFLLPTFIVTFFTSTAQAVPDIIFYSTNDITHYDPTACANTAGGGGGVPDVSTSQSEDQNAETIFTFLISTKFSGLGGQSFNAIQAAGALGNFYQESHFDPGAVESAGAIGDGHGLAQWSYNVSNGQRVGPGRRGALFDFAKAEGKKWDDMGLQLKMIEKEINASYGKSLLNAGFGSVKTPKDASYIFQKIYEGAGTPAQDVRDGAAKKYYEKFKDLAPDPNATPGGATTSGSACGGAGTATEFSADGFVVYDQCDTRWADVAYGDSNSCRSGCGPAAMAAAITALTGETITPKDTVAFASKEGMMGEGGSKWTMPQVVGDHWKLNTKQIPATIDAINDVVKAGGLVIMAGKGATPFTSRGHYILVRGLTDSGKWKISDSNGPKGQENSKKEWDARAVLDGSIQNGIGSIYSITK